MTIDILNPQYKPNFPDEYRPKVGIVGVGNIVRTAHLPAYKKYGVEIGGVYDISPASIRMAQENYDVGTVFDSLEAMLDDPSIDIIDIATHPAHRVEPAIKALEAGKHVLAQKPVALDVASTQKLIEASERTGKFLAVNQNGRFAPPWRIATSLVESGVIGDVFSVTHMFDTHFGWMLGTIFDTQEHWLLYDYAIHFFDISRVWMGDKTVAGVRARDYRIPVQPAEGQAEWGAWTEISYTDGSNAMIRSIGGAKSHTDAHLFWVHGAKGTVTGSILHHESVTLEADGKRIEYKTEGSWFVDGFAGTLAELVNAIHEGRQPSHSVANNLLTLQITLAACESADRNGELVTLEEIK